MAFIQTIDPSQAEGELKVIYEDLLSSRGKIAEVHKIQSLNPQSIVRHMDLYMTIMFGRSPLSRVHREMMAVVVSKANDCEYCQIHHLEAVKNFWKDDSRLLALQQDYRTASLDPQERALCDFAWSMTKNPETSQDGSAAAQLRDTGIDDRGILDATLVVSYFNFVNRIVLALGVQLEENPGGYKYE